MGDNDDQQQRLQPVSMGDSVSRNRRVAKGARDGNRRRPEGGGFQRGDTQAEGSAGGGPARVSDIRHSPGASCGSNQVESSADPESLPGKQPDSAVNGASQREMQGEAACAEANGAPKDTNQAGGAQKAENRARSSSGGLAAANLGHKKSSIATHIDGEASQSCEATNAKDLDQAGGPQERYNGDHKITENENKKEQQHTQPDNPTKETSNSQSSTVVGEHEGTNKTASLSTNQSNGSIGNDHLPTESDNGVITADESKNVDGSAEIKSNRVQPNNLTEEASEQTASEEHESAMESTNQVSESLKDDGHVERESVCGDVVQAPSSVTRNRDLTTAKAKDTNKHSCDDKPPKMESEKQPSSLTLSGGEHKVTSEINIEGANQQLHDVCHDQGGDSHLRADNTIVEATILAAPDEKDRHLMFKVQTEFKPDRLIISLISENPVFKHARVDGITTVPQVVSQCTNQQTQEQRDPLTTTSVEGSENDNVAIANEETTDNEPYLERRSNKKLYFVNFCFAILLAILACCVAWYSERENVGTFDLENFFMQNPETASQWERLDRRAIRILVTGKTGTGKSALINGLIGRNVTKEGDTLDPTTARVEQIKQMVHGISMSVFDSPGLQDGTSREHEYLQDMQWKCEKVDLVLYAIKMTDQRVHAADTKAMKKITDAFGHKFWEKAILVMTFANEVRSPEYPDDEYENEIYFEKRLQDWKEKLPSFIEQRSDIPIKIGKHVPIVPAGYYKIRDLPGRKFWFSQFWKAALDRMMESSAEGAGYMLQFSKDRLKNYNDMSEEDFQKPIHEQPILSKIVNE